MADDLDFNNSSLLRNQDLEEAEELEERKRREVEMQNLISHAMSQFNFDEQSTMNSSVTSNEGDNSIIRNEALLREQYREANANEQLRILYDVRVREVEALNKQIQNFQIEFNDQQQQLKRQITLLENEKQRLSISLTESHSLVVEKIEQIKNLSSQVQLLQSTGLNEETKMKEMQEENEMLRQLNMDFEQQILVVERGFPLKSTTADKEFQECQRVKIDHLEHSLRQAKDEINNKNQHYKQLEEELKLHICNKQDDIREKNVLINSLSDNNEQLERQLQECMRVIQDQNEKLNSTNNKGEHLERELQKIREVTAQTEALCEHERKNVAEQFQGEIFRLTSENNKLIELLHDTSTQLSETKRHMETKSGALEGEKQDLENRLRNLQDKFDQVNLENRALLKKSKQFEEDINAFQSQQASFVQLRKTLKIENENLKKKIIDLEVNCTKDERAIQTSLPYVNNEDFINFREQLHSAHTRINILESEIMQLQEENSQLQVKIGLEQERESLIKKLQEKAAEFEKIIQKKQKIGDKVVSVGTNTITENSSTLKIQHDTLLYQTEAKLHKKLKKEFDDKLKKATCDYKILYKCNDCQELNEENQKLVGLSQQDRNAVVNLVSLWETKFLQFQKVAANEIQQLGNEKTESEQSINHAKQVLKNYMDKYKETKENLEKHISSRLESERKAIISRCVRNYSVLSKHISRLQLKIQQGNDEIHIAEQKFLQDESRK